LALALELGAKLGRVSLCFLFEAVPEVGFEGFEGPTLFGFALGLLLGQGSRFGLSAGFFLLFAPPFGRGLRALPCFELGPRPGLLFGD
jgi:hypothetical protein